MRSCIWKSSFDDIYEFSCSHFCPEEVDIKKASGDRLSGGAGPLSRSSEGPGSSEGQADTQRAFQLDQRRRQRRLGPDSTSRESQSTPRCRSGLTRHSDREMSELCVICCCKHQVPREKKKRAQKVLLVLGAGRRVKCCLHRPNVLGA